MGEPRVKGLGWVFFGCTHGASPCYGLPEMPTRVPKGKVLLSVAIDPELREAARAAAEQEEVTLTVFVTRALRERLAETPPGGTRRVNRTARRER